MLELCPITAEQLDMLRRARDELPLPPANLKPSSFWLDADLLVALGCLVTRRGRFALTLVGRELLERLELPNR